MPEPKTRPTNADVAEFLAAIANDQRRADAEAVCRMMAAATGKPPVVWGTSIVGFGSNGSTPSWPVIAFAARAKELVLYLNTSIEAELFDGLGPHRRGASCVYVKRLADLDQGRLKQLVSRSVELAGR
ncbi:MAG: DUF1801 domain-containing protein [Ilumatobacteraceae bacterium]